jgi:hypothetical protein
VRPWSLEGDAATPLLLTMLLGSFLTESGMSALLYAVVQRVQQQARTGRSETCGVEETTSSSTRTFVDVGAVLNDLHHHAERGCKQKPNA